MRTSRRTKATAAMTLLLAASITLAGCSLLPAGKTAAPELVAPVKLTPELLTVNRGSIARELNAFGIVVPLTVTYVPFTIDGKIDSVNVRAGVAVNKGDALYKLQRGTLDMDLKQQRLALANAQLALQQLDGSPDDETARLAHMSVEIEQLKLDRLLKREQSLPLTAPVSGIVTFADDLKQGDAVVPYRDILAIADPAAMQVKITVGVSDMSLIANIDVGMPADVTIGGTTYKAKVAQTPSTAPSSIDERERDINSRTLLIRFDSMPANKEVSFGVGAAVRIVSEQKDNVVKLPRVAVRSSQGRSFVQVMDGGVRKEVDVERGMQTATEVEITNGLKEGQQVIVNN
ncbi:MAG: efflux RND transporter periplasmic adaptor subunit [Paenibacillaceae bacterium]|nr:efflux RND transporter periplasmic adaptor subunit [Paenibacillaceae bacterium]